MFITTDEMKSVLYDYQMNEIAEGDEQIVDDGILSGVSEVKSYFTASNQKQWTDGRKLYDIDKIFGAVGSDRDPFVLRMCKTVAAYYICELCNADVIYEHVKERYDNVIKTLEKIASMGYYINSPALTLDLPTIDESTANGGDNPNAAQAFRSGSRPKFRHEYGTFVKYNQDIHHEI